MNGYGCVPMKLYLQNQVVGQLWPAGCSWPTPGLEFQVQTPLLLAQGVSQAGLPHPSSRFVIARCLLRQGLFWPLVYEGSSLPTCLCLCSPPVQNTIPFPVYPRKATPVNLL
jgi:hypothetical protein